MLEVEMSVDNLAEFLFLRNVNDAMIELSLDGLQNAKDFFFFSLDLFCKGLIHMYGNGNNIVHIQDLQLEDFVRIKDKLRLAGIDVQLDIQPPDVDVEPLELQLNLQELRDAPDNLPLKDYVFILKCSEFTYTVQFDVIHNTDRNCNNRRIIAP